MAAPYPTGMSQSEGLSLRLTWSDGHESDYPPSYLRYNCSCAHCVNEGTGARTIQLKDIPVDIHPLKADPVGRYAIQITWSDGHSTGIYSYDLLRRICPCPACTASRRGAKPS